MTRTNVLYLVIGALAVAVAVLSYQLYQDRHQPEGLHINVGPNGLSIQGKYGKARSAGSRAYSSGSVVKNSG